MVSLSRLEETTATSGDGMRPINLRSDLAPLADLIEVVFAESMDSSGRAALREMRYLSKLGVGLPLVSRVNELAMGISLGYVWIEDGRLVGNVSVYPSNWPRDLGRAWIIANVGVHPDYQRRGIAQRLMHASMEMIRQRKGGFAVLQVDIGNHAARALYRALGFVEERAWTVWRRAGYARTPEPPVDVHITHRRRGEWRDEMALARRVRPPERGGLGWLRPLHASFFRRSWGSRFNDWLSLRSVERLVIRDHDRLAASLWVQNGFGTRTQFTLLVDPDYQGTYDEALINYAVRRFGRQTLTIEHPHDEALAADLFRRYRFLPQRTVIHMRWDP